MKIIGITGPSGAGKSMLSPAFEKRNIPISVFMMDKWHTSNSYEFNEYYKTPKSIVDFLHSKKIKIFFQKTLDKHILL